MKIYHLFLIFLSRGDTNILEISEKIQIAVSIFATGAAIAVLIAFFNYYVQRCSSAEKEYLFLVWLAVICGALAALYVFLLPLGAIWIPIGIFIIGYVIYLFNN